MKLKKTLKYVFSFLLVLCMMCGLVGNYVPGGTVEAEGVASSYTVTLNGRSGSSHFWMYNATASDGPITLKYTVNELSSDSIGTNGVVANQTTSPYKEYPSSYGSFYKALKPTGAEKTPNIFMKVGCTYTLTIGKNASGVITFAGGYVDEKGTYNSLDNPISDWADWSKSGAMGYENKSYKHFGVFFSSSVTGTLTNVTCVDASGNDLGITSNQSGSYAIGVQKEAESLMPTSYTVALNGRSGDSHFWMYNATASDGPITLKYTVNELSSDSIGTHGVVANQITSPYKEWPSSYGSFYKALKPTGAEKTPNIFMKVGCTYTLTIGKNASGVITFAGGYVDEKGTYNSLDNPISDWADWSKSGAMGYENKSYKHFGVFFSSSVTGTLTNVTCVDASGNDLGITSNQSGSYAIKVTEEKNPMVQEFTATKYENYHTNKKPPIAPEGYVFAGWYSDKTCTTALKADAIESTATAYAKYVDADVLSVKYQLPANVSIDDNSTTLRLVTTVDSLQYSFVGFQIYIGDEFIGAYKTKDVYEKITGTTDSTTVTYKPYVFSSESEYFMAVEIIEVPSSVFDEKITVIPAWETLDGTVVEANARQDIVIADAIATLEQ